MPQVRAVEEKINVKETDKITRDEVEPLLDHLFLI